MILTCPRCATRYLVDDLQVWTTGRTVQCEACEQAWKAFGSGARPENAPATGPAASRPADPPPETETPPPVPDSPPAPEAEPAPADPVGSPGPSPTDWSTRAPPASDVGTSDRSRAEPAPWMVAPSAAAPADPGAPAPLTFRPLERGPAAPAPAAPIAPLTAPALFPKPRAPAPRRGGGVAGLAVALAVTALLVASVSAAVVFENDIVHDVPALAPVYSAVGLPARPVPPRSTRPATPPLPEAAGAPHV